jgi:DNA-binding transcriptional regulator LsrR (DeoR family)
MSKHRQPAPAQVFDEARIKMISCALLRSQGFMQVDIAERMHLSQPEVSRLLDRATRDGVLRAQPTLLEEKVDAAELDLARQRVSGNFLEVEKQVRKLAPAGLCFRLHTVSAKDLQAFHDQAAQVVANLLSGDLIVGTMWGSTIDKIIDGVARFARPSSNSGLRALPLAGDPLYLLNQENQQYSASVLAAKLERAFVGKTLADLPSLNGVPAYISRQLMTDQKKAAVLNDFIRAIPGYHRIFGPIGYVHRIDTVLTGVGVFATSPQQTTATFIRERERQEGTDFARLRDLIWGDFAGILLPRNRISAADKNFVKSMNQGWTGVTLDQLKEVARKAKTGSPPGVIAVGFSAENKTGILRESLRRGLINHLVVDEVLAKELAQVVED